MPIEITLHTKHAVYRPGDVVSGDITIFLQKEPSTTEVELEWTGIVSIAGKDDLCSKQNLFRTVQKLTGEGYDLKFEEGEVSLPFRQRLPSPLPPSYGDLHSKVCTKYKVEARLKKPWEKGNVIVSTDKTFYVVTVQELSSKDLESSNITKRVSPKPLFCCLPEIETTISLNKSGFVPGEDIEVVAFVRNNSSYEVSAEGLRFFQIVSTMCDPGYSYSRDVIFEFELSGLVIPPRTDHFRLPARTIPIPALLPTCNGSNNVMSIKYELQYSFKTPFLYRDLFTTIPITIATYPYDVAAVLRTMKILPPGGSKVRRRPNSDLDSDDFSKTLEIVSPPRADDALHASTQYNDVSLTSDSDDDLGNDNPVFQTNESGLQTSGHNKKSSKCVYYKKQDDGWILRYVRHGEKYESNISPKFYNNL